ncbi:MAG: radical SAM family heme chaperone HemW [Butyrivibrio sp.]|nr:radical SAM family heme chaperone HemW [Acetatifactor muris]MCM1558097.1 radical SAM family heme chaperone HemW [Butyrivibrio sp.]MCM1560460.1 radical SAM family heme chaperone HemW [Butyrivibrio sp.]
MTSDIELYFHIPFCVRKCYYCDFLSAPADACTRDAYMAALERETAERAAEYTGRKVVSVFIGGGTPSVVEAGRLASLLRTVGEHYRVSENAEITVEVNPGTVDGEKLKIYRAAGVNRLSIGLQSADDGELAAVGRIHTWRQFLDTYEAAVAAGFTNINADVMSALPGQTYESYCRTLQRILELKPALTHISAYSLIPEEGTYLWEQLQQGRLVLPDEDTDREMYSVTKTMLEQAGYVRYEISNYARPGFECRHNCGYWRRREYAGFGTGAASLINNVRFRNRESLQDYLENPSGCRGEWQTLSAGEQMEEFMFLGLRMTEGVSGEEFACCFGKSLESVYGPVIEKNKGDGLLEWKTGTPRRLALTERGLDLANYVMAQFLL